MRKFLLGLFILISSVLYSQVSWEYSHKQISEDEVELTFKAKIEKGWKLYSQHQVAEAPTGLALEFHFIAGQNYDLVTDWDTICWQEEKGCKIYRISENSSLEEFDDGHGSKVRYFKDQTIFTQIVKINRKDVISIPVRIMSQACEASCIMFEHEHKFQFSLVDIDDDSGCMDPEALNYDPNATIDDESCVYPKPGCTDSTALNYDSTATQNDGSCDWESDNKYVDKLVDLKNPVAKCKIFDDTEEESNSLWWIFFLGVSGGLLALITPCVFPMIPLTVSFFTKSKREKGIFNAIMYGFFIMLIYFLLSIPFHIMPDIDPGILNQISTNTWLNIVFFLIFMAFAFSFFGYYELTLPSKWGNKADSGSNIGGLIGIFFMALTLAIVSFSCTGPILGTLLAGTLGGDISTVTFMGIEMKMVATKLTLGMTGFGLALGFPFAIFALFPRLLDSLPQSGGWLNSVKVVLGFLEIALAIKFLSNADMVEQWGLIKRETYFILWFIVSVLTVLYLIGKIRFPHDTPISKISKTRYAFIAFFMAFSIYLIPGMFGSHVNWWEHKLLSGFPPPLAYSYTYSEGEVFHDYWQAIEHSKKVNKPVFVDFTGWNCTNCRDMEENVFPEVKDLLDQYVICQLYVDERRKLKITDTVIKTQFPLEIRNKYKNKKIQTLDTYYDLNNITNSECKELLNLGMDSLFIEVKVPLTTVGGRWKTLQHQTYIMDAQPWYVLYSYKDGLLTQPIGRSDVDKFSEWLQCGLDAFHKNK